MDSNIVRTEENGVEYFTVVATGESGISGVGIARSLGISSEAVRKWHQKLSKPVSPSEVPKSLQPLIGKASRFQPKGWKGNRKPYSAEFWACLAEYYAYDTKQPTKEAIAVFRSFARIGAESYIQSKTGWLPEEYKAAPQAHEVIDRIRDTEEVWELFYSKPVRDKFVGWFGVGFYWEFCYHWLTPAERCKLEEKNGDRHAKIHQFLSDEAKERLKPHIQMLLFVAGGFSNKQSFVDWYTGCYGSGWQLSLF